MKKFLFLITLFAAVMVASAQSPGVYTFGGFNGGTNNVAFSATNSPAKTIAVSDYDNVGIQISLASTNTATGNVIFKFAHSADTSLYETAPATSITVALDGTNTVTKYTNVSIPSTAALKLTSIENGNLFHVTNIVVKMRFKAPRVEAR